MSIECSSVTIHYALRRRDIWNAYWFTWRSGWALKFAQICIAASVFYLALAWQTRIVFALLAAIGSVLFLPLYPLLLYKPQMRELTITPWGVRTQIGKKSAEIKWNEIKRVAREGDRLYLIGRTGNSFAVPDHAFASVDERNTFEEQIRTWRDR